jgi:hypothetical protein
MRCGGGEKASPQRHGDTEVPRRKAERERRLYGSGAGCVAGEVRKLHHRDTETQRLHGEKQREELDMSGVHSGDTGTRSYTEKSGEKKRVCRAFTTETRGHGGYMEKSRERNNICR